MTDRYTCHAKIMAKITFPDPDGDGHVEAVKGEIRLMIRDNAKELEAVGFVKILSDEEAKAAGLV